MTTKQANKAICDYFRLLEKTGQTPMCQMKKVLFLPFLVEMTEGTLSVYATAESQSIVRKFTKNL